MRLIKGEESDFHRANDPSVLVELNCEQLEALKNLIPKSFANNSDRDFMASFNKIQTIDFVLHLKNTNKADILLRDWMEARCELHDCTELKALLRSSQLDDAEKVHIINEGAFTHQFNPNQNPLLLTEMSPRPEDHLRRTFCYFVEFVRRRGTDINASAKLKVFDAFFNLNSIEQVPRVAQIISDTSLAKEAIEAMQICLKDTQVFPNRYFKSLLEVLQAASNAPGSKIFSLSAKNQS